MADDVTDQTNDLLELTATIVAAHVGNNKVGTAEVGELIASTYAALAKTAAPVEPEAAAQEPAVSIRSSVKNDYIVCLEDGAKLKMLKRYLRTRYDMSPEDYRKKWGLPHDYPMVAPAYAEQRRGLAHAIGLGRKKVEAVVEKPVKATKAKAAKGLDAAKKHLGTDAPTPKRGRPPKAKVEHQEVQDTSADRDADVVREPLED